ncbi:MAG: hypothetical protein HYT73_00890 [Candidatus Aenigmarchaeota archaeon]|nr:hypothetical protein [Candidatus Aenigmarchaeota archaeon]
MAKASFILSLIAGILVLINGLLFAAMSAVFAFVPLLAAVGVAMTIVGLIFGILILVGAWLMQKPKNLTVGSILVLVFSLISLSIGGGFIIGTILGVIGGALGLAKK